MTRTNKKKGKAAKFSAGLVLGLGIIAGAAYGADYLLNAENVPRGATVGGVEIGGMSRQEAISTLERELGARATQAVQIHAGERTATLDPVAAGLTPNWQATVDGAGEQSRNPITRLTSFVRTYEIGIASDTDEPTFNAATERVTQELSPAPVNAEIKLEDAQVRVDPTPADGQTVELADLRQHVLSDWLHPEGVTVDAKVQSPERGEDAVEKARAQAEHALLSPITVHGREQRDGVIPTQRMGEVVSFVPDGKQFRVETNRDNARNILNDGLAETEKPLRNAYVALDGSITPSSNGVALEWDKILDGLQERILSEDRAQRTFEASYRDEEATFTTEQAQSATFDQVVGEFTTSGYSAASGVNIARVAQMVNGAMVAPGETFSLNGYTGPRGTAQGFVESGIILNGRADTAVGGGISQFATTLYNASYFAGMEDVAHTAHSYYISRYPAGREATVFEGAIDLQFKNTSQYPVRILANAGGGSVTVQLMGVKTVQVESINGGRWAYTNPQPVTVHDEKCSPSSGAQGFTTSDTRVVRDLSGNEISRNTTTTVYDPSPIVRCA